MGNTCVRSKEAVPKDEVAAMRAAKRKEEREKNDAAAAATGDEGGKVGHSANKKAKEREHGGCGGGGAHRNKNNNDDGIAAYRPEADMARAYREYVQQLRTVAIATGLLPPRDATVAAAVETSKKKEAGIIAEHEQLQRVSDMAAPIPVVPPVSSLTVYQCQLLSGESVVAKGLYSTVHLARLSVFTGLVEATASVATLPRHPASRRNSAKSSISFCADGASSPVSDSLSFASGRAAAGSVEGGMGGRGPTDPPATHYIIATKELRMHASYSSAVILEQMRREVRSWSRLSAYTSRVVRCYQMEYVYADKVSMAVPSAMCNYHPGLVSEDSVAIDTVRSGGTPSSASLGKILDLHRGSPSSATPNLAASMSRGRESQSPLVAMVEPSSTPQLVRVYVEYARYGTLRGCQTREMPERYRRTRLHELTARAYMRDVLLALLQLHEVGELQYDLSAKAVFVCRPVQLVYGTAFPAYIADIPSGDLTGVTPIQLTKALTLLDPPLPPPTSVKSWRAHRPSQDGPVSSPPLNPSGNVAHDTAAREATGATFGEHYGDLSLVTNQPSQPMLVSVVDVRTSGAQEGNASSIQNRSNFNPDTHHHGVSLMAVDGDHAAAELADLSGPLEVPAVSSHSHEHLDGADAHSRSAGGRSNGNSRAENSHPLTCDAGHSAPGSLAASPMKGQYGTSKIIAMASDMSGGKGGSDDRRLNGTYACYMDEYDFTNYEDDMELPFPSPHDGVRGQADAELLASTMLPEEARDPQPMRVVPLRKSNLGGIAILVPDHRLVKMDALVSIPDPRGRLPMLLAPSTDTSTLVCGGSRLAPPRFTPMPEQTGGAAAASASPTSTHAMSAGTSMRDATGPLGRSRGAGPLTKLNHGALLRRAMAYGDADKLEDVPMHKFVAVTTAAPEVLHRRAFSAASDIYAFAMTFIELVTDDGAIMTDCLPTGLAPPTTRGEKEVYDERLSANLLKWYQSRAEALWKNYDAVAKEQELPESVACLAGPTVIRIPEHLSDEARGMLRWCLQHDPQKRPSAAELLRSRYFMLGDWIAAPTVVKAASPGTKQPEKPWDVTLNFDVSARAVGLPTLRSAV